MVKVEVEFIGLSRVLTGTSRCEVTSASPMSYADIVLRLSELFPKLVNQMIDIKTRQLLPSNLLSKNGKTMITPENMKELASDGEHLILMSILAGGSVRILYQGE